MSISSEPCYECGRCIPDGSGEAAQVCFGILPGGARYWTWVEVCPECARRSARDRWLWRAVAFVLISILTSAVAYPFLP
jgi:hypothetical protein